MRLMMIVSAWGLLVGATLASGDDAGLWRVEAGASVARLRADGSVAWRFQYSPEQTHAYFHPLAPAGHDSLTVDEPGDHVHHHGLWFSWKYINGVNFWEHAPGSDRPAGRTVWTPPKIDLRDDGSARFEMVLSYRMPGDAEVLTERRVIEVSVESEDVGVAIDWSGRFQAVADEVVLDRTPPLDEPGGVAWGGYAGLSLRMVQLNNRSAMTLEGEVEFNAQDRYRGRSGAFAYNGGLAGEPVGVAILTDPSSLNSPSPWYGIRSGVMTFFTPAVLCYGPHAMAGGEHFDLRYRIIARRRAWTGEELAGAFGEFTRDDAGTDTAAHESDEEPTDD
jgi:hypothetical protein